MAGFWTTSVKDKQLAKRQAEEIAKAMAAAVPAAAPQTTGVPGLLMKLAELRDAGVLTAAEYDAKKLDLLARL